jgi:hypothetical protein
LDVERAAARHESRSIKDTVHVAVGIPIY